MGEQFIADVNKAEAVMRDQRIATFKKSIDSMIATSKAAYVRSDSKTFRDRFAVYSKEDIHRICERGDSVEKAKLSEHFFKTNGLYKRIILHYATFLFYCWLLVPHTKNKKDKLKEKKLSAIYYDTTDFCTSFQIERKCTLFAKEVLVKGAYYGLIHANDEYIAIQDLPFEFCRSRFKNHQDVDIVEFSMKFFDTISDAALRAEILKTYPKLIQKSYFNYKHNNGPCWIFLPAEMGIYFSFFEETPFFMDLIPLLDDLDDYKEMDKKRNLQALGRILVQKVGTDGLKLVFEPDEAEEMHEGVIEMLQDNPDMDVITTYNDISLIDLSSKDDEKTSVDSVQNLVYDSAGITKQLFASTTDAGLKISLSNDLALMMILAQKFAHFFTVLINNKFSNKKLKFKFLILPISHYNYEEYVTRAKDLAAFGYSFLTPILSTGIDQTNLADLKELENDVLELDEVLKPLQSAYTQSGKTNAITALASKEANTEKKIEEETNKTDDNKTDEKQEENKDDKKEISGNKGGEDK